MEIINPYVGLAILGVVITGFLVTILTLAHLVGPKNANPTKQLPFECGSVSVGSVKDIRFNVKFYLVAMLFILFDIEVIFMYPWAVTLLDLGWSGFTAMMSFMLVLSFGLVYVWRRGVLDWQ